VATVDKIETIHGSVVQHGRHNDRIYLMHLHDADPSVLVATLDRMAVEHGYGKILAKIPATAWRRFQTAGYIREAIVPGFFKGETDGLFIAKFFSEDRQQPSRKHGSECRPVGSAGTAQPKMPFAEIAACTPAEAGAMAGIYARTFETYAFPIHRPEWIRHMMAKDTVYFCARVDKQMVSLAAAEIDVANRNCEMTDFATLPEFRRLGLASRLLHRLDKETRNRGVKTAYTIARADSKGMNRVFAKAGYRHAGRLVKNTQIGGRIRSMHVWYKRRPSQTNW